MVQVALCGITATVAAVPLATRHKALNEIVAVADAFERKGRNLIPSQISKESHFSPRIKARDGRCKNMHNAVSGDCITSRRFLISSRAVKMLDYERFHIIRARNELIFIFKLMAQSPPTSTTRLAQVGTVFYLRRRRAVKKVELSNVLLLMSQTFVNL